MRTHWTLLMGLLVSIAAFACPTRAAPLNVVTTTTDLKAITEAVGGDKVKVTSIACGYEDPHCIQAKPSFMLAAQKADLWIRIGLELEIGWEGLILEGSRNPRIHVGQPGHLDASQSVLVLEVPTSRVTRAMGDVHPSGNPHYWLDPLNARIVAKTIADRLAELSPGDAEAFKLNLRSFQSALDERMFGKELVARTGGDKLWAMELKGTLSRFLDERKLTGQLGGWKGRMLPLRGAKIVTYHRSWVYFSHRFGLVTAAEIEPKPGVPPTGKHLNSVIERVKADAVKVILIEPFYSRKSADLVAGKTDAKAIVCPNSVGGEPEVAEYLSLVDLIVARLADNLRAD